MRYLKLKRWKVLTGALCLSAVLTVQAAPLSLMAADQAAEGQTAGEEAPAVGTAGEENPATETAGEEASAAGTTTGGGLEVMPQGAVELVTGWQEIEGETFYFDSDGQKVTGLHKIEGSLYYFDQNGKMLTGFQEAEGRKYYFTDKGPAADGWFRAEGGSYYANAAGQIQTGLKKIDGKYYYFTASGRRYSGFRKIQGAKYYFGKNGQAVTGLKKIEGARYYFKKNGQVVTGLKKIEGVRYCFKKNGQAAVGLKKIEGARYYFNKNGQAVTGLKKIQGAKYYFKKNSQAALGFKKIQGVKYYFQKNGQAFLDGWKKIGGKTYYFKRGMVQTDQLIDKKSYVDKHGVLVSPKDIYYHGKKGLTGLEQTLQGMLRGYGGTWCVYVKNLNTNEYMVINNQKVKAASLIKMYNMATTYHQIYTRKLAETSDVNSLLYSMITVSSNDSYNSLLPRIGGTGGIVGGLNEITRYIHEQGYNDTNAGGTLGPSAIRTPVWLSSSYTTVQDCGHILEDIYRGALVNEEASEKMLSILLHQTRKSKIPAGLPAGVASANKTGEYEARQHDAAIVFSPKADYIITVMTEGDGSSISHIHSVSRTTYDYFNN